MSEEKELKGFEIENQSVKVIDKDLVGSVDFVHVGKLGSVKLNIEGKFELVPILEKGIDKLEELIPGDQKAIAAMLKSTIKMIKL